VLLEAARDSVVGNISRDVALASRPFMDEIFATQLFRGEDSRLQQLLRNNANRTWPIGFSSELNAARRSQIARYLCPTVHGHQDSVINTPILLALNAVNAEGSASLGHPDARRLLRTHAAFDPDWFADAFDLTVARCLATGLLRVQT
jgi:hypothetical protein